MLDFQAKIQDYNQLENEIAQILLTCNVGSLSLNTEALTNSMKSEVAAWQAMYARSLIDISLQKVSKLTNQMMSMEQLIETPLDCVDIEQMRALSSSIREFYESDASFAIEIQPLSDGLHVLEQFGHMISHENNDAHSVQLQRWNMLQMKTRSFSDALLKHRPQLLLVVQEEAQKLSFEAMQAKSRMESHGPFAKSNDSIETTVAHMLQLTDDLSQLVKRAQLCNFNEHLLQAPCTQFPNINQMMAVMLLGLPVCQLYVKAKSMDRHACDIPVSNLSYAVSKIASTYRSLMDTESSMDSSVHSMPVWIAYKQILSPWIHALPFLESLQCSTLRPRHWIRILDTIKFMLPQPMPRKSAPFGLEPSRVEASIDLMNEFLNTVQDFANEGHTAKNPSVVATSEFRLKLLSITSTALSTISASSLMCLTCCLPEKSLCELSKFPESSRKEIEVEERIEYIEGYLADAVLSLTQLPKTSTTQNDSDDLWTVTELENIISGVSDCRMQLWLLKEHPHAGAFLQNIQQIIGTLTVAESGLLMLSNVQQTWLNLRSFVSMMGSNVSELLQPGDMRVFVDNQRLISKLMAQIRLTPNILDLFCSSSTVSRTLPIVWQNSESLMRSLSSALLDIRMKFPELFCLNDYEAAEVLSLGWNVRCLNGEIETKFVRTFAMFPSIEGVLVQFTKSTGTDDSERCVGMQTIRMISNCGEQYELLKHSSVCDKAVNTLTDATSAAKLHTAACHSSALQELFKQTSLKLDHRASESSYDWMVNLLRVMPTQPLLLALWTFFTDLVESALERISTFSSPSASSDEIFLEPSRYLSLCSRAIAKTGDVDSKLRSRLEIVLTGVIEMDEIMRELRNRVVNGQCSGSQDFEWFCHFRYYFNSSRGSTSGNMIVEVAGIKRTYSFQPVSGADAVALPMVTASARVAVAVVSAVSGCIIPMLVGPAGVGKSNIAKSVAAWLGQPCLVIDACCNETAIIQWTHAVTGCGYWGVVTNTHLWCSKASEVEISDGSVLKQFHVASHISFIIRTIAESRRNGRVCDAIMIQGTPLLPHSSTAFIFCGRSPVESSLNPISQCLRNLTRTVSVKPLSSELRFTIALRVDVGLTGSRSRTLANQLELMARCVAAFRANVEGYTFFSKNTFMKCVLAAAKKAQNEVKFLRMLMLEVQRQSHPIVFNCYMDAHKAIFGLDDELMEGMAGSMKLSSSLSSHTSTEVDFFGPNSEYMPELLNAIRGAGLAPSKNFCNNVLKLGFNIENCQNVIIAGPTGSGRSSITKSAFGFLKSRCARPFSHFVVIPGAQSRVQLFGTFDGGGLWLKGLIEHLIGHSPTTAHDNQRHKPEITRSNYDAVDNAANCPIESRVCLEFDYGSHGDLVESLAPALRDKRLLLNNGSSLSIHPNVVFLFKVFSLEKCSPAIFNLVTPIVSSANDVETADVIECCIRRVSHPLKDHALKVAKALLVPYLCDQNSGTIKVSQNRYRVLSFFSSMMAQMLAYDAWLHDSEKNDSYAMIGEVAASDIERFAAFSCLWAAGAELESNARIDLASRMRSVDMSGWFPSDVPQNKCLFDYFPICDVLNGGQWVEWSATLPTGSALHNILHQTSQSFNRTRSTLSPCLRRVYVPTKQSIMTTFLCDLLLPSSGQMQLI